MYVLLIDDRAYELIPEHDPDFPGVPVEERYPAAFLSRCVQTDEDVRENDLYIDGHFVTPEGDKEAQEE